MKTKISIIGAGIAGLTTAIAIQKTNPDIELEIFESKAELKPAGAGLTLAGNALKALDQIGLLKQILAISNVITKMDILDVKGKPITGTDHTSLYPDANNIACVSVLRTELHKILLDVIPTIPIYLSKRVIDFYPECNGMHLTFQDGTASHTDFIIAADGIHSVIREKLIPGRKIRYAGYTCWRGIAELKEKDPSLIPPSSATESWGQGKRFGIVPLTKNRVYWFACINAKRVHSDIYAGYGKKELVDVFSPFHKPVCQLIENTEPSKILWNDIIDFAPVTKYAFENILLIGDAAHATTPNMGQGACQAIEDAAVLSKLLAKNCGPQAAFQIFEQKRIKRASSIVNKSWQIGKVAQMDNAILMAIRNLIFRMVPDGVNQRQARSLFDFQA